jgi:serine/threonine protein kinase
MPTLTLAGMVLGTVHYFAPELAQGRPAIPQSDVYAAGIVLYEMLTGTLPFDAENPLAVAMQQITQAPTPPRRLNATIPPSILDWDGSSVAGTTIESRMAAIISALQGGGFLDYQDNHRALYGHPHHRLQRLVGLLGHAHLHQGLPAPVRRGREQVGRGLLRRARAAHRFAIQGHRLVRLRPSGWRAPTAPARPPGGPLTGAAAGVAPSPAAARVRDGGEEAGRRPGGVAGAGQSGRGRAAGTTPPAPPPRWPPGRESR